jgi:enoyl-CoA hydratase/carnithine racemase
VPESFVSVESRPGGVALVTLERPPLNALCSALLRELAARASALASDAAVKAVVITGNDRAFAAGADVSEFTDEGAPARVSGDFRAALDAVASIPRPVIAAVRGFALGGGCEVALACDLRVASDGAKLGFPEIQLGIFPGGGGTQRLPRLVGPARAKEIIWTGRHVSADEALAIGLVDRVVPNPDALDAALEWAASFASGAVVAMGIAKRVIDQGLDGSLATGLDLEAEGFSQVFATDDARVGIRSFLDQGPGKATFSGR